MLLLKNTEQHRDINFLKLVNLENAIPTKIPSFLISVKFGN